MNTNVVIIAGRLTRNVELRATPGGKSVAEVSIANNRKFKTEEGEEREESLFVDVTVWGRPAETTAEFCKTGSPVLVTGRVGGGCQYQGGCQHRRGDKCSGQSGERGSHCRVQS